MKSLNLFLLFMASMFTAHCSQNFMEYLYPIASVDDHQVLLLHQRSPEDLELLLWDYEQMIATKELGNLFFPHHIKLLPSKHAYSFIDHGRIRIKSFAKRAPKSLDIYEPISDINSIEWLDDEHFYFVGNYKQAGYKMFFCDISCGYPNLFSLQNLNNSEDFVYPHKIDNQLFYVRRNRNQSLSIEVMPWDPHEYSDKQDQSCHAQSLGTEIFQTDLQICCLRVQSIHNVFIATVAKETDDLLNFEYHAIHQTASDRSWSIQKIFNFSLPKNLLVGSQEQRLHESIEPFLPIHTDSKIYFVHFDAQQQRCNTYQYDATVDSIDHVAIEPLNFANIKRMNSSLMHIFAPCPTPHAVFCGVSKTIDRSKPFDSLVKINPYNGMIQCELPYKNSN